MTKLGFYRSQLFFFVLIFHPKKCQSNAAQQLFETSLRMRNENASKYGLCLLER